MYSRILAPVDFSDFSRQMIPIVDAIGKKTNTPVTLLRIYDKGEDGHAQGEELHKLADPIGAQAVTSLMEGSVTQTILAEANKQPGTLVAICSHGRSGVLRAILGSTALNVLREGGNPILVYRPRDRQEPGSSVAPSRVVVPLDGSPVSESMLPQAVELAKWLGARLVLVSVIDPDAARGSGVAVNDAMESNYVRSRVEQVKQRYGIDAGWEVLHGDPKEAIPAFVRSEPGSMLAMTTRGRSALKSAVVGGVTTAALRDGGVPIYTRVP